MRLIDYLIYGAFGTIIGSFLNLCMDKYCKRKAPFSYIVIGIINGLLYIIAYHYFKEDIVVFYYSILSSILLTVSVVDYYTMLIPNKIIIFGTSIASCFLITLSIYYKDIKILAKGLGGMLTGGVIIGLIMLLSLLLFKKQGMGMGDLKLLAMIGLFVGSKLTIITILIAVFFGSIVGVGILIRKKENIMPFGPFISLGAVTAAIWGEKLCNLYFNYMIY